ncbi:MAG: preprotein translocase subunit SecY [Actinobacteria bacterium]|nr:preprotein translocase subunit SecY [Actinomycetota bacterium]
MLEAARSAFNIPDLRKKIFVTIGLVTFYRFGAHIPVPGIDMKALQRLFEKGGLLGFMDLFSGGALSQFAIFALGIMPYITASIIMELLTIVIPKLGEWAKEGEAGRKKITQITRYFTLFLALVQSIALTFFFAQQNVIPNFTLLHRFLIVLSLTTGTVFIMWLGELITQHGIGNGMSLLIFTSIISRFPIDFAKSIQIASPIIILLTFIIVILVISAVVVVESGQRRIPVQYAKRVVGRKMYGGHSTYIPLKINQSGVMPIIFASSVLLFPATIAQFMPGGIFKGLANALSSPSSPAYLVLYTILIIFFSYFYTAITFNPLELADNMKKYGGFVPGVRPGKPTAVYLDHILSRIILPGAIFLAVIAVLPTLLMSVMNVPFLREFGGTSVLIVVGVALETMKQLEAQLLMRNYEGFLK